MATYSTRLDETGTDGRSPFTVVAGAVALPEQWEKLEKDWENLLRRSKVSAFHWKEFRDRSNPNSEFANWSELKRSRFIASQEKIISGNTVLRMSVGVDPEVHADVKDRMKGITGFTPESDYSLALRYLMFATCEELVKIDPDCRLTILVEHGPWAAGAEKTYRRVAAMSGKYKPAKHAHRLAGFATAPKGHLRSLEAADYLAASEQSRLLTGKRPRRRAQTLSLLMTKAVLEQWYKGMMDEKEARRAYGQRQSNSSGK